MAFIFVVVLKPSIISFETGNFILSKVKKNKITVKIFLEITISKFNLLLSFFSDITHYIF